MPIAKPFSPTKAPGLQLLLSLAPLSPTPEAAFALAFAFGEALALALALPLGFALAWQLGSKPLGGQQNPGPADVKDILDMQNIAKHNTVMDTNQPHPTPNSSTPKENSPQWNCYVMSHDYPFNSSQSF